MDEFSSPCFQNFRISTILINLILGTTDGVTDGSNQPVVEQAERIQTPNGTQNSTLEPVPGAQASSSPSNSSNQSSSTGGGSTAQGGVGGPVPQPGPATSPGPVTGSTPGTLQFASTSAPLINPYQNSPLYSNHYQSLRPNPY